MALNGIDISDWQRGINLTAVPADFVIAKATEGTGYVSPDCARQVDQAISAGKLVGVYHYVNGSGAVAEADFFVKHIRGWVGTAVLAIDWEQGGNAAWGNTSYLDQLVARVIEMTGVKPLIYASSSVFPWQVAKDRDCGAWVAQYANNSPTGFQADPWSDGSWSGAAVHQYSSAGRLPGYGGNLDLNVFFGDASAWRRYASSSSAEPWRLEVTGVWDAKTGRRFREVMGVPLDCDWSVACKAMQYALSWQLDAYALKEATGVDRVPYSGVDDPITWKAWQAWWNRSRIPEGHRIPLSGACDAETIRAVQIALNHSWAGSRGFAVKP